MIETTYLTIDELKEFTPISKNVDVSQLESFIPVAEDMYIIPILGLALDTDLKTNIENGTVSGNNETLIRHIINASAYYSFYEAAIFIRTKAMNKGLVQQFSDNSQVVPYEDFKQYRQSILDKAVFYTNVLTQYLIDNKDIFTLWRCSSTNPIRENLDNSSGIYVG